MTAPKLDRRQVLKLEAAAMAALAGGMQAPSLAANLVTERGESELKWDKAPCRFCGTGCSVMVAKGKSRGRNPWRHQVRGQPWPQLREGLFPLQDHVRP
jgi:anaerobic selenocysteine-containing dehydrogenase